MKLNLFPACGTGRFIDLTPLPDDVRARRTGYRVLLSLSCVLTVGCTFTQVGAILIGGIIVALDSSLYGLVFRLFL